MGCPSPHVPSAPPQYDQDMASIPLTAGGMGAHRGGGLTAGGRGAHRGGGLHFHRETGSSVLTLSFLICLLLLHPRYANGGASIPIRKVPVQPSEGCLWPWPCQQAEPGKRGGMEVPNSATWASSAKAIPCLLPQELQISCTR